MRINLNQDERSRVHTLRYKVMLIPRVDQSFFRLMTAPRADLLNIERTVV
jgi:hypothetical protein